MGKKGKEEKKESEEHNVHNLLGQPALVQIVDRGLTGKSDQEKKVSLDMIFTTMILAINVIKITFKNKSDLLRRRSRSAKWSSILPPLPLL